MNALLNFWFSLWAYGDKREIQSSSHGEPIISAIIGDRRMVAVLA